MEGTSEERKEERGRDDRRDKETLAHSHIDRVTYTE